jgi:hypothetical protein
VGETLREFRIQQKKRKAEMKDSRDTVLRLEREISSLQEAARSNTQALAKAALEYQTARAALHADEQKTGDSSFREISRGIAKSLRRSRQRANGGFAKS